MDYLALAGATAWTAPWFYDLFKKRKSKLSGKIISRYVNFGKFKNKDGLLMLIKLSLLLEHKEFNLKNVKCIIELEDGTSFSSIAISSRYSQFNIASLDGNISQL